MPPLVDKPVSVRQEKAAVGALRRMVTSTLVDYPNETDDVLVELLMKRDVLALEALYGRHARAIYSLSLKILGESPAAEDVVQECFLKLWRQPELYQAGRGKLLSWLLGITHHRAIDQLRRRKLEQKYAQNGQVDPSFTDEADPERRVWSTYQSEAVGRALAGLPPTQRVTLEMAYLRGMTQVEIAAHLGEPLGTIKTRMRLAIQKLRVAPELLALAADAG